MTRNLDDTVAKNSNFFLNKGSLNINTLHVLKSLMVHGTIAPYSPLRLCST